ncbi:MULTISPECIES: hypothetical protein [unclassified Streptomyces]|uniref:hypothetical protein n=1 Tax=unclassified Streptomyces TaxID=2593676 RepID=UPI003641D64A
MVLAAERNDVALSGEDSWSGLDRLAENEVPVAAAVYQDDMFVDREHSLEAAKLVRGLRAWVSDAHAHDGVKADPAVLDRLIATARGEA